MLTPPFAVLSDLADRWRPLSAAESERAVTLLEDASQMILDEDKKHILDALTTPTLTHARIVCKMVERAMGTGGDIPEVTPFLQTNTVNQYGDPVASVRTGDIYLTKAERRQLGFTRQRAGGVNMWTPPVVP